MRVWVVCATFALVLAGCAEPQNEETMEVQEPQDVPGVEPLAGRFVAEVAQNLSVGMPFNVTLSYLDDDSVNVSMLSWSISFMQVDENATSEAADDNATSGGDGSSSGNATSGGNSTADGNATAGGNATADGNATAAGPEGPSGEVVASYNGTGLPAVIEVNLTEAGNFTLVGTITDGNRSTRLVETAVSLVAPVVELDPCAGAPVQDPITISDLFVAVAVDGTGLYQGHAFDLEPCQTMIFAEITSSEAYIDPMLRLKDHTGATVDAEDNEFLYHDTLTYEPGGYLEPGTWQIDARGYIGAPGNYEIVLSFAPA